MAPRLPARVRADSHIRSGLIYAAAMEDPMDLAATDRLLCTTRSVRKRLDLDRKVEPELIERCIEISLQAPTGSNAQGWRVVVVTDPA